MSNIFDHTAPNYANEVQSSINFSGLKHDFFLVAKADILARVLRNHFGAAPPRLALDIGCGVGLLHPYVSPLFGKLAGADTSSISVDRAKHINPGIEYSVIEKHLPYPDDTFDVTLTVCVLHHVPPEDRAAFARDMRRVTRPGGLLCVIEHNPFNPMTQLAVRRCSLDADAVLLPASETKALLQQSGASNVETEFFLTLPLRSSLAVRCERLLGQLPLGAQYLTIAKV